ncbi:MAG: CHASE2 domain-containing protein, partial [Actinomycetota bacterium]|nr:CHASE2 domain-containing protein [Actinomycetota bacterium]
LALAALVAVCAGAALALSGALDSLERQSVSTRFQLRKAPRPTEIVVVGIDDETFSRLREQWPFRRSLHARAVDRLHAAGAREIVYDVQFTEPTEPAEDLALYRALGRAGGAVLATSEVDDRGRSNVLGGDENLARIDSVAASTSLPQDPGGATSRFGYAAEGLRTLAVVAAERASGRRVERGSFPPGGAWIDYRGGPGTFPTVSFADVVAGDLDPALVRDRVVVVGATAPSLQDTHATPTGKALMSGPELEANAIWTALHGFPLRSAPAPLDLLLIALLGAAPLLAARRLGLVAGSLAMLVLAAGYAVAAQLAFNGGVVLGLVAPLVTLAVATAITIVASHVAETRERRRVAVENEALERRVRERTAELHDTQLEIVRRLGQAAESRDEETGQHIERISRRCHDVALAVGLDEREAELVGHASAMHDIGKIGIPDRILLKPGRLDPDEWETMKTHARIGASILAGSSSPLLRMAETIALTHHERWDGTGYPEGLCGEEIPLEGRICAVCDVYDALVSDRPYKASWSREEAMAEIARQRGRHFDPAIADAFLTLVARDTDASAPPMGDHWDANVAAFAERVG